MKKYPLHALAKNGKIKIKKYENDNCMFQYDTTWKVIWYTDSIECSIVTNDTEKTLIDIVHSIHRRSEV